jgi:iron complex transport system permease protein
MSSHTHREPTLLRVVVTTGLLAAATMIVAFLALGFGSMTIGYAEIVRSILFPGEAASGGGSAEAIRTVVATVRLPRVLLGMIVGGSIAVSGVVFQVFIRNVLADPYILGISGGASTGALLAIASGLAASFAGAVPLCAFAGAVTVAVAVFAFGNASREGDPHSLLLGGVMIGSFLSAVILVLVSIIGDPVRNALFWLIGYLGNAKMEDNLLLYAVNIPCMLLLASRASTLNVYALGGETAHHLGVSSRPTFLMSYGAASLMTALSVSVAGTIGFIGLIIPHVARALFGADHRILIPTAFFSGAMFLVLADLLARSVLAPIELPAGAVTAAIGAPLFIALLRKK